MTCTYTFEPADHDETSIDAPWSCSNESHDSSDHCVLHMDPGERDQLDVTDEEVATVVATRLQNEDNTVREFIGAHIPTLDLDYIDVEGDDQHPVDFRHTTIPGGISVHHGRFEERLDIRHSTIGGFNARNCDFENGVLANGCTFTGDVSLFEMIATGDDADFTGATFEAHFRGDEADFSDDVSFEQVEFLGPASFKGTEFYGRANSIGDNTTFDEATFHDDASFLHATFEYTSFQNVRFKGDAVFEKADANGTVLFTDVTFEQAADYDEVTFNEDALFDDTVFEVGGTFRGVEFNGGAAMLEDDVSFANAVFGDDMTFERGTFGYTNFEDAAFHGLAMFERTTFTDDATFARATFHGDGDFDEVVFDGDADFTDVVFHQDAIFRGGEFRGGTNYLEDDVLFTNATFVQDAEFQEASFISADFINAKFQGSADFTDAVFDDELHLKAVSFGDDTFLNFTEAVINDGELTQPKDGWVRFDLTKATLGEVTLSAENPADERELLDYFRFCDTTFNDFDFSHHTGYLDRNEWDLHHFDGGSRDYEFAVEMTPAIIEKTYLKAKNSASDQSNIKAAGEFRVKRQEHARDKFFNISRDTNEGIGTRFRNWLRGAENWFLGVSCGYGLRLYRVTAVFILFPLLTAGLFTIGGPVFETGAGQIPVQQLFTLGGLETFFMNVYFSYITFLTIGYGGIGPIGPGARVLAGGLVYMNVIIAGLFLYALIKRSEI